ncbi:hypothetical protein NHJ13051_000632 [Beauveria bassiana]
MVKPESSTRPTGTRQQTTDYLQNLDQDVLETMTDKQRQRVKETNEKVSVPAIKGIQSAVKSGASPREAHAETRASLFVKGEYIHTYHMSNVFDALENIVKERREQIAADSPYYVTTDDLDTLTQALDSLSDSETCCISLSTEMYYKMAMAVRPMRGLKPAGNELDTFHEEVMLEECRRMLLHEHVLSRNDRGGDTVDGAEPLASTSLIAPHSTAQTDVGSDADPSVDTNSSIFDDQGDNLAYESSMPGSVTPGQTRLLEVPATPERQGRADGKRPQQALVERTPERARLDYDDAEEVELGVSLTASVNCEAINAEKARKAEEAEETRKAEESKAEEARKAEEEEEARKAKEEEEAKKAEETKKAEEGEEARKAKEADNKKVQEALVPVREPWDFELPCNQGLDLPILLNVLGDPPGAGRRLPRPFPRDAESSLLRCKWRRHF